MATPEAQEAAAKERIIKHMNADHQDSIQRYLEHRENASFFQIRNARMTDINLNDMRISYAGKQAVLPFDPPMKSLREARERLVQMDKDALVALDRSDIPITTFIPCYAHVFHFVNWSACFLTYIAFSRSSNFKRGSMLYDNLLYRFSVFVKFCLAIQPWLMLIMLGIHIWESVLMIKKLRKHGMNPLNKLWWLWVGTCFVEGVTSFRRLDGWIAERRKEKEAKKH